ncbi:MAG: HNH endonuclease [Phycisphaerae bacterium]|nr:HNH endonuclease [Phycisphaerae bacterium]
MSLLKKLRESVASLVDPDRKERTATQARGLRKLFFSKREGFDLDQALSELRVSEKDANAVIQVAYDQILRRVWHDGAMDKGEKRALQAIAKAFGLSEAEARHLNYQSGLTVFEETLGMAIADGIIDQHEMQRLQLVAASLDTNVPTLVQRYYATEGERFLRSLFLSAIEDGKLGEQEWDQIVHTLHALGFTSDSFLTAMKANAQTFVEHVLADAKSDGKITEGEETTLTWLLEVLRLDEGIKRYVQDQVKELKLLDEISRGRLPIIPTPPCLLDAGEVAHFHGPAFFSQLKTYKSGPQIRTFRGEATITDQRLLFSSPEKSCQLTHPSIIGIVRGESAVEIRSTGRASGYFVFPSNHRLGAAIYDAALRKAKQTLLESFPGAPSRSIPREVRQRVWQRYGGRCAECGATSYLEFDHIVPFAKGGSSTDSNVQLLCRTCNLKKSDLI